MRRMWGACRPAIGRAPQLNRRLLWRGQEPNPRGEADGRKRLFTRAVKHERLLPRPAVLGVLRLPEASLAPMRRIVLPLVLGLLAIVLLEIVPAASPTNLSTMPSHLSTTPAAAP